MRGRSLSVRLRMRPRSESIAWQHVLRKLAISCDTQDFNLFCPTPREDQDLQ